MVSQSERSPRILDLSRGHMQVEGIGTGKDFKLYPGGGRAWGWAETGTRHSPGIQPADVEELLAHGATSVVLSLGHGPATPGQPGHTGVSQRTIRHRACSRAPGSGPDL